jgi:RNA polymerase sigma factor (sigma-70 family)
MAERRQLSDAGFIEGLRNNEHEVLNALYKKFFSVVLKYVLNNSGTEQEAKDVYQETIIVVYENVRKPGFELSCQLQTYIFSIAKRLWLKQLGKQSQLVKLEDDGVDVGDEMAEHAEKEKNFSRMHESLDKLGEPCKTLISDFYLQKMNMDLIAEKFGYTNADTAKNQKYKCLQRLKKMFFGGSGADEKKVDLFD